MMPPFSLKRSRDSIDEDEPIHQPCEKARNLSSVATRKTILMIEQRSRASGGPELLSPPLTSLISSSVKDLPLVTSASRGNAGSPDSMASEAGSSTEDVDMDDDDDDFEMSFSVSPDQRSPWAMRSSPPKLSKLSRLGRLDNAANRVPTPIVPNMPRPQPTPLHTPGLPQINVLSSSTGRSNLGTVMERFPSPTDDDEPHTPTTAAGSQLSLLTVNDMDMDLEPASESGNQTPIVVRKQRSRSGAFTVSNDSTRKFSMGYREDCEKCRNRVPGHMNHFLGR
ncbi:hypothetical protein H2203_007346 [Taxawa tesnikishii (nom. ined.)]|nr:hypothetical protein H2203_007346 [Dothideales sp. JES 119]